MRCPSGSATDLPHPKDMDGMGGGAGLRLLHCEACEARPQGGGGGLGKENQGEEEEQQGERHLAPQGTRQRKVGFTFLQSL